MANRQRHRPRPAPRHRPKFHDESIYDDYYDEQDDYYPARRPAPKAEPRNLIAEIMINHASFFLGAFFTVIGFGINFYYEAQDAHKQVTNLQEEVNKYKETVEQLEAKAKLEQMMKNAPLPQTPPGR